MSFCRKVPGNFCQGKAALRARIAPTKDDRHLSALLETGNAPHIFVLARIKQKYDGQ